MFSRDRDEKSKAEGGFWGRLVGASGLFFVAVLTSRTLGMVREMLMAHYFGASSHMDAYSVAYNLPLKLGTAINAIASGAMIPVVARYLRDEQTDDTRQIIGTVTTFVVLVGVLAAIAGVAEGGRIATVLAPEFNPDLHRLTARLLQVLAPYVLFAGIGAILSCGLLARRRFLVPALAHIVPNIVIIALLVTLASKLNVFAVALGVTAGGLAYVLVLAVRSVGITSRAPSIAWVPKHPGVRRIGVLALPLVITAIGAPIISSYEHRLLSGSAEGVITSLRYARGVTAVPIGLLVASIGTVLLPMLSWDASSSDDERLGSRAFVAIRLIIMTTVLAMAIVAGLRRLVVTILYGSGKFTSDNIMVTSTLVLWLTPRILSVGLNQVFAKTYHALQDTLTPALIWLVAAAGRGAIGYALVGRIAARGVAFARCIAGFGRAVWLGTAICARLKRPFWRHVIRITISTVAVGAATAWGLNLIERTTPAIYSHGRPIAAAWLLLLAAAATVLYTTIVLALNPRERAAILTRIRQRIRAARE